MNSEIKLRDQARGTRIIAGDLARERRQLINRIAKRLEEWGASEIVLPSVEEARIYTDKAGPEILGQMYTFPDRKGRELCLRPEGTATVQLIAQENTRIAKDTALWYEARCWRYERPQAGRYREFTQIGLEILRPKNISIDDCIEIGYEIVRSECPDAILDRGASRGLAYYTDGTGWEVRIPKLGAQQQVLGGGPYAEGFGFAIGLDRILLAIQDS